MYLERLSGKISFGLLAALTCTFKANVPECYNKTKQIKQKNKKKQEFAFKLR